VYFDHHRGNGEEALLTCFGLMADLLLIAATQTLDNGVFFYWVGS
jgi:hypothetical protein